MSFLPSRPTAKQTLAMVSASASLPAAVTLILIVRYLYQPKDENAAHLRQHFPCIGIEILAESRPNEREGHDGDRERAQ